MLVGRVRQINRRLAIAYQYNTYEHRCKGNSWRCTQGSRVTLLDGLSLAVTILGWPDSWFGVVVNVAILAYLLVGARMGWLP